MKVSGTWLVAGLVGLAAVFAALVWHNYAWGNPLGLNGRIERDGEGWIATVRFPPSETARVGAPVKLTVPDRPKEPLGGVVETVETKGLARIRLLAPPPGDRETGVRAEIPKAPAGGS